MAKGKLDFKQAATRGVSNFDLEMYNTPNEESSKESNNSNISNNVNEVIDDYQESLKPFATRLPIDLIARLKQHQYWDRESIMDAVINALNEYLNKYPDADKPLPEAVLKKLRKRNQ